MKAKRSAESGAGRLLAIDVSNSFTKIALFQDLEILKKKSIPTNQLGTAALPHLLKGWKYDAAIISSVVPKAKSALTKALSCPTHWVTNRSPLGIGIDYPKPATIGADRLCNAVACVKMYRAPAIVVDIGTAVTFDVISSDKKYIGGVIAPGLDAMTEYLHKQTALLPRIKLREPRSALGKSTTGAMRSGAVIGYRGLIRGIVDALVKEQFSKRRPALIATGGGAGLILSGIPEFILDPNLTLAGLALTARQVFKI